MHAIKFLITKSTPCWSVIQNLVILGSVIGSDFALFSNNFLKKGTTEPLDPTTFPYLTTENLASLLPAILLAATKSLSEASFVAPYKFIGFAALSVEGQ